MNANAALVLPRNIHPSKDSFESLGFTIVSSTNGAYKVGLPKGWTVLSLNHNSSMILDDKKRKRGLSSSGFLSIKSHNMKLLTRYSVESKRISANDRCSPILVYIADSDGKQLKGIGLCGTYQSEDYAKLVAQAENYLDEMFPNWRNPSMYWD